MAATASASGPDATNAASLPSPLPLLRATSSGSAAEDIKTMKLYSHFERVERELALKGLRIPAEAYKRVDGGGCVPLERSATDESKLGDSSPLAGGDDAAAATSKATTAVTGTAGKAFDRLDPNELYAFDCMHYHGCDAVDVCIDKVGIVEGTTVLDIGSGLGGVARYLADKAGASVLALELQPDVDEKAAILTRSCKLEDSVKHLCGDITEVGASGGSAVLEATEDKAGGFDCAISFLCFLHITDKTTLLRHVASALKPGGVLYVEDFFKLAPFTAAEEASLANDVFCRDLPTREEYLAELATAGFDAEGIDWVDMTKDWTAHTASRAAAYHAAEERHVGVHGQATFDSQAYFFDSMASIFAGGNLGGVRFCVRRGASAT